MEKKAQKQKHWVKTFLNPAQKGRKYARELKEKKHLTNDGIFKVDKDGKEMTLDDKAAAYRAGYLDARSDNTACYLANKKKAQKAAEAIVAKELILEAE